MKILYFCNVNRESKAAVGVFKKIDAQIKILRSEGHTVDLASYSNEGVYSVMDKDGNVLLEVNVENKKGNKRTSLILQKLREYIPQSNYSCIYSRYETYSIDLSRFYKKMSLTGCLVLLEVPTYPISQRWTTIYTSLENRKYKIALHQLYNSTINSLGIFTFNKVVSRIVNNNGYSVIWGIPTLKINNAVDVASIPKHSKRINTDGAVSLIGVANIAKWHGYDRIISGLRDYYNSSPSAEVEFHIVGDGLELVNLKRMTNDYNLTNKVFFHGTVVGQDLNNLFDEADIGVSILGAHRSHMKSCDSLKSKEYCARNLPFISGEIESMYKKERFAMTVPDNESPVDISKVVTFARMMKADQDIEQLMENYACNNCDWSTAFSAVLDFIGNNDNEKN